MGQYYSILLMEEIQLIKTSKNGMNYHNWLAGFLPSTVVNTIIYVVTCNSLGGP